jgi:hypothetical protein
MPLIQISRRRGLLAVYFRKETVLELGVYVPGMESGQLKPMRTVRRGVRH